MDNLIKDIFDLICAKLYFNDLKTMRTLSKKFNKIVDLKNSSLIVNEPSQIKNYSSFSKKYYITPKILDSKINRIPFIIELEKGNNSKLSDIISVPIKYSINKLTSTKSIIANHYDITAILEEGLTHIECSSLNIINKLPNSLQILKVYQIITSQKVVLPANLRILEIRRNNNIFLVCDNLKKLEFAKVPYRYVKYLPKTIKKLYATVTNSHIDILDFSVFENLLELHICNNFRNSANIILPNNLKSLTIPNYIINFSDIFRTKLTHLNICGLHKSITLPASLKHLRVSSDNLNLYEHMFKTLQTFSVEYHTLPKLKKLKKLMIYSHKLKIFRTCSNRMVTFYPQKLLELEKEYAYEIRLRNDTYEFITKQLQDSIELKSIDYVIEKVKKYGSGILRKILRKFKNCSCLSGGYLLELFGDIETHDIDIFICWTKYSDLVTFIKKELNNSVLRIDYNILEVYSPKLEHIIQFIFVDWKKNPVNNIVANFDYDIAKCCVYIKNNRWKFEEFDNALDCIKKRTTTFNTLRLLISGQGGFKMLKKFTKKRILMKIKIEILDNIKYRLLSEEQYNPDNILNDKNIYFFSKYNKFPEILLNKLENYGSHKSIYLSTKDSSYDKINRTIVRQNKKSNYTSNYPFNDIE